MFTIFVANLKWFACTIIKLGKKTQNFSFTFNKAISGFIRNIHLLIVTCTLAHILNNNLIGIIKKFFYIASVCLFVFAHTVVWFHLWTIVSHNIYLNCKQFVAWIVIKVFRITYTMLRELFSIVFCVCLSKRNGVDTNDQKHTTKFSNYHIEIFLHTFVSRISPNSIAHSGMC